MQDIMDVFKEISKIPRQSGDEAKISDFLMKYAEDCGLSAHRDEANNVIIRKPSTISGYTGETVILQGHMDMVYVKANDSTHSYADGIDIIEDAGFLRSASMTSLGADNGIAVAYMAALMKERNTPLPSLEFVVTAEEEVGLKGAQVFDASSLKGKYFINLDSEEEGVFITSCAGGVRCGITIPVEFEEKTGIRVTVSIDGLSSGHSGLEIHKQHANAIKLAGRIIHELPEAVSIEKLECEGRANVIAKNAEISLICPANALTELKSVLGSVEENLKSEFRFTDDLIFRITCSENEVAAKTYSPASSERICDALNIIPNGVLTMSLAVPGIVQTSCNWGSMEHLENGLYVLGSLRSLSGIEKNYWMNQLEIICRLLPGCSVEFINNYPEWEYSESERLRELCAESYEECLGRKAEFTAIHAGLECGYFAEKLRNCELISFGPNIFNAHTYNEKVELRSISAIWEILISVLRKIARQI